MSNINITKIIVWFSFHVVAAAYFNESESSSEDEDYSPFEDWKKVVCCWFLSF